MAYKEQTPAERQHTNRFLIIILIVFTAGGLIVGIYNLFGPRPTSAVLVGENPPHTNIDDSLVESEITLEDGRTVKCVIYDEFRQGGVSCDW